MRPTIAVITGSLGRPSLEQVRRDVRRQCLPGDEHVVEIGGAYDESHNQAISRATADWLMFVTDDDLILPGAMNRIRRIVPYNPARMHLFQNLGAGWSAPRLKVWETGGGMVVTPNIPGKVGIWGDRRQGDFDFITSTLALLGTDPVWRSEHIVRYNYYVGQRFAWR
jgi:hypothetical protein